MCNTSCLRFGLEVLKREHVEKKRVLEVGSRDVNGSLRPSLCAMEPAEYLGIDIEGGKGVDAICDAAEMVQRYGRDRWDVVVCTEVLEHVWDWQTVCTKLKQSLAPRGMLLITTRSIGFPYHPYPVDFWRFELSDLLTIFADLRCERIESDPEMPGVFFAAEKPEDFKEKTLDGHALYSILSAGRVDRCASVLEEFVGSLKTQRDWLADLERRHHNLLDRLSICNS